MSPWSHDCSRTLLMAQSALVPITTFTRRYTNVTRFEGNSVQSHIYFSSRSEKPSSSASRHSLSAIFKVPRTSTPNRMSKRSKHLLLSKEKKSFCNSISPHLNQEGHGSESPTGSHTLLPLPWYQHVPMISTISQIYNRNKKHFVTRF